MTRPRAHTSTHVSASLRRVGAVVLASILALLLLPEVAAQAQTDDGGVRFSNADLRYEVVHQNEITAGHLSPTQVNSAITAVDVASDGTVFFAEVNGAIKVLDPDEGTATLLTVLSTSSQFCATCTEPGVAEGGLHGFAVAPDYEETGHVYATYAVAGSSCEVPDNIAGTSDRAGEVDAGCWHLSRLTVSSDLLGQPTIDSATEDVILTWPFSRYPVGVAVNSDGTVSEGHRLRTAAHQSGGVDVLSDGTIVVSAGDNTDPDSSSGYGPRDPRPQRWFQNAERTSQNPADRRGKLLRVNPDGTVPADNPYVGEVGEYIYDAEPVAYDPYILTMGLRNPYHIAADPLSDTVFSGQVGADAVTDDPGRGPAGVDELDVITRADCDAPAENGLCPFVQYNGGYPRCIGPSRPYIDYDYEAAMSTGEPLDCSAFDEPALWYPKTPSDPNPWPQLNGSGTTIMPGDVYRHDDEGALPELQDRLLLFDWSRGWLAPLALDADGNPDVDPSAVSVIATGFLGPIDAAVAPDGSVYVAEHGPYVTTTSRIGRIVCDSCSPQAGAPVPMPRQQAAAWPLLALAPLIAIPAIRRRRII